MATPTVTSIGSYTKIITLAQSTFTEMKDAVKNTVTGLTIASGTTFSNGGTTGWDLVWEGKYDSLSPHYTQVFRSKNFDNVTYKCAIFNWNIPNNELNLCTCERFGTLAEFTASTLSAASSTVITNPAWTFYDCATIGWKLDLCDLVLNIHPRWLLAHAYINSEPCLWAGVFEMQRNDEKDIATQSNPCWGWIGSTMWNIGIVSETLTTLDGASTCLNGSGQHLVISMPSAPKFSGRVTGIKAAVDFSAHYGSIQHPSWMHTQYSKQICTFSGLIGNTNAKFQNVGWDSTKRAVYPITPIYDYRSQNPVRLGQIYGLKVLSSVGANMNKISLKAGDDGIFSASATSKDHYILNLHHKVYMTNQINSANITRTIQGAFATGYQPTGEIISTGSAYFVLTRGSYRVYKVDATSGTTTSVWDITAAGYIPYCMRFDGERYVYVGHSSGIAKIDVYSSSVTAQITTTPARGIGFLNGYLVYGSGSTIQTAAQAIYKLELSTNTQTTFGTTAASSYSVWYGSVETDFYGNVTVIGNTNNSYWSSTNWNLPFHIFNSAGVLRGSPGSVSGTYFGGAAIRMVTDTVAIIVFAYGASTWSSGATGYYLLYTPNTLSIVSSGSCNTLYHDQQATYMPPLIYKHSGNMYGYSRYHPTNGYSIHSMYTSSSATNVNYTYVAGNTLGAGNLNLTDAMYTTICTDGARLITGSGTNASPTLRITTGWNSEQQYNNVKLAQVAILS